MNALDYFKYYLLYEHCYYFIIIFNYLKILYNIFPFFIIFEKIKTQVISCFIFIEFIYSLFMLCNIGIRSSTKLTNYKRRVCVCVHKNTSFKSIILKIVFIIIINSITGKTQHKDCREEHFTLEVFFAFV